MLRYVKLFLYFFPLKIQKLKAKKSKRGHSHDALILPKNRNQKHMKVSPYLTESSSEADLEYPLA